MNKTCGYECDINEDQDYDHANESDYAFNDHLNSDLISEVVDH